MGNSESVIAPRSDKRYSSGRYQIRVAPQEHDYYHQRRKHYPSSSDSDASSYRSTRRTEYVELASPRRAEGPQRANRPSAIRYSKDYSRGGHGGADYIVDRGYVVPGQYPRYGIETRTNSGQDSVQSRSSGIAYNARSNQQGRQDTLNPGGSYIPRPHRTITVVPNPDIYTSSPNQYSRRTYR
jgi:hypothetical protein